MRAIEVTATVGDDGELRARLPVLLPPGEHQIVVMLPEEASEPEDGTANARSTKDVPPLELATFPLGGWTVDSTYRREDIYDDDGRC